MPLRRSASSRVAMPFSVATRWSFASRTCVTSNWRAPSLVVSGPYSFTANGSSVNVHSFTAPRTPCAAPIRATQIGADTVARRYALRLRGGFGGGLALLARHGLFRVVALLAFDDAGGIQEARDAIRRLRALGEPGLDLVHVELQARLVVLRQQRIEVAETLDEAAVAGKARVGDDDVIDRALLGAGAGKSDNNGHWVLLKSFEKVD